MESSFPMISFGRQRKKISSWVGDIAEEISLNEKLIGGVKKHAEHMRNVVNQTSSEVFPSIFAEANSSLSKYNQILTEINCKLEVLLTKEIRHWNSTTIAGNSLTIKPFTWNDKVEKVAKASIKNSPPVKPKTQVPVKTNKTANSSCSNAKNSQRSSNSNLHHSKIDANATCKPKASNAMKQKAKTNDKAVPENKTKVNIAVKKADSVNKACSDVVQKKSDKPNSCTKSDVIVSSKNKDKKTRVIRDIVLSCNTTYEGYITLMVSPLEFYICFVTANTLKFSNCLDELESHCKKYKFPTKKPKGSTIEIRKKLVSDMLGDYALLHSDKVFHRVKINDWNMKVNDDNITVTLIDSGKTKNVSLYNLHPIPDEIMKYPAFATRCHLSGVPKQASEGQRYTDSFRSWIDKNKVVTVEVGERKRSPIPDSLPVVVYDKSKSSCVNVLLMGKIEKELEKEKASLDKWDPMSEAYESNMNKYDFDVDDPAAAIYGYIGKDYDRVCKLYGNTGKCYKKACKKEHVLLDSKGFTTDKEDIYIRAFNLLTIPKVKVLDVRVTHVESPSSFYCVLDTPESDTKEETFLSLHSYMNESRNITEMKKMLIPPAVGQVVIAKFPADDRWYRARVVSVLPEKDECTLFNVDHGNTANVNLSCIRAIEPRYLHLPFQAIFCEICGIGYQRETSHLAITYLRENLTDVSRVVIVSTLPGEQPHLIVSLYTSEGENVATEMLIKKLVAPKENIHLDLNKMYLPG